MGIDRDRRRVLGLAFAGLGSTALGGCQVGRLLEEPTPPRLFTLTPATEFAAGLPRVRWQLLVETPLANTGIDTTRVALEQNGNQLTYFARANWVDTAPEMIQLLLVESFENSNRIVAVGREASGLRSDFVLKSDLRDFQADYGQGLPGQTAPVVKVRMTAKLVRMPRRVIVAGDTFQAEVRAASPALADVVTAFDRAMDSVLRLMVEWTLRQGEANAEADPLPNLG